MTTSSIAVKNKEVIGVYHIEDLVPEVSKMAVDYLILSPLGKDQGVVI